MPNMPREPVSVVGSAKMRSAAQEIDVYNRQIIYRSEIYRQSLLINLWSFNRDAVGVVEIADDAADEVPDSTMTAIPVSYTHLDVYKRQEGYLSYPRSNSPCSGSHLVTPTSRS